MSRHIGIVACSAEGAALCYRTICVEGAELMGRHAHPEVSMHTFSLAEYMEPIYQNDWATVAELMLRSAEKLARVGADFLICPDNTIHQAFAQVEPRSPLPWLHIADQVAREAERNGHHKLGVMGTKYLMEGPVYPERLARFGLGHVIPMPEQRERINQIIFDELVYSRFLPASLDYFQQVIAGLQAQGCDAVVLGCTEIPLLVRPEDSPLPVLDSTRLLARAALCEAVREEAVAGKKSHNETKAPPGHFRVIGIDAYDDPITGDYLIGDFEDEATAIERARTSAGPMSPAYVYDDAGKLVASFAKL